MVEIILVCLGTFQNYITENINNLLDFNNSNITVITNKNLENSFKQVKSKIKIIYAEDLNNYNYDNNCKLNKKSNNGLWFQSSNRFFYLYDYIKKYNIEGCFHIENDVMIYANLNNYIPNEKKIYLTMDSHNRCIPSLLFIPSHRELERLIKNYNNTTNDMNNLGIFFNKNKDISDTLPIVKQNNNYNKRDLLNKNYEKFNAIFDAAAIGQYLGGCHYNYTRPGFINETCLVKYNNYNFYWKKKENNFIPHLEINNELIPIVNLHIHRKNLNNFRGKQPIEDRLIKFI